MNLKKKKQEVKGYSFKLHFRRKSQESVGLLKAPFTGVKGLIPSQRDNMRRIQRTSRREEGEIKPVHRDHHQPRVNKALRQPGTAPGWHIPPLRKVWPEDLGCPGRGSTLPFHDATLRGKGQVRERRGGRRGTAPGKKGGAG